MTVRCIRHNTAMTCMPVLPVNHAVGLSAVSSRVLSAVAVELFSALTRFETGLKFGFSASPESVSARCPVQSPVHRNRYVIPVSSRCQLTKQLKEDTLARGDYGSRLAHP
jgi:hypothetical protein